MTKTCKKCQEEKSVEEFSYKKDSGDKLSPHCYECKRKQSRESYLKNPEAKKQSAREYYKKVVQNKISLLKQSVLTTQ